MAVHPDTASALVDVIFMLGRTIRTTMSHMEDEILPTALIGVLFHGYVERNPDPDDKRAHRVRVSDAGIEVLRGVRDRRAARLQEALVDWDESEMAGVLRMLGRLNDTLAPTHTDNARRTA